MKPLMDLVEEFLIRHELGYKHEPNRSVKDGKEVLTIPFAGNGIPWFAFICISEKDRAVECKSFLPIWSSPEQRPELALHLHEENSKNSFGHWTLYPETGHLGFFTSLVSSDLDPTDGLIKWLILPHFLVADGMDRIIDMLEGEVEFHERLLEDASAHLEEIAQGLCRGSSNSGEDFDPELADLPIGGSQMVH